MWTRVPDLPKGSDNSRFGGVATHVHPAFEQHDSKPRNRCSTSPQVIDQRCMVDLAKKDNPCLQIEENKQE